jgi:hypothetical protein
MTTQAMRPHPGRDSDSNTGHAPGNSTPQTWSNSTPCPRLHDQHRFKRHQRTIAATLDAPNHHEPLGVLTQQVCSLRQQVHSSSPLKPSITIELQPSQPPTTRYLATDSMSSSACNLVLSTKKC